MVRRLVIPVAAMLLIGSGAPATADLQPVSHVLLLSIDGLHQNDLEWFIKTHPHSTLARLAHDGIEYTHALAPFPSDSFPGLLGQVTGGHPKSTGIYYDDAYSRELLPPGTTSCKNATPGAEVHYARNIDKDPRRLDAGQNIPGLYAHLPQSLSLISSLSGNPARDLIDASRLPVDPVTCQPLYPHQYLKVNTVFEVAHARGLHTAWSDKHPAFDILNGPSGVGVDDLFTPEVNSSSSDPDRLKDGEWHDFGSDNLITQRYDGLKVAAVLNWIKGHDHAGRGDKGEPAIFGMNFQSVVAAQRLNTSHYRETAHSSSEKSGLGGYVTGADGQPVPGAVLAAALEFVDASLGRIVRDVNLADTVVIVSAKHGQSPQERAALTIIDDDAMIAALNSAWMHQTASPRELVALAMDDDSVLLWLNDRSQQAAEFAAHFLHGYNGIGRGFDAAGNEVSKPFTSAGVAQFYAGRAAASFLGVEPGDPRVPDLIGMAQPGSVYGGGKRVKIAEHGGGLEQDRHVALLIAGAHLHHAMVDTPVETISIAPTILKLLKLDPNALEAVRQEGTPLLPGLS